jgi:SAM-dependent methyltransferase
MHPVVRDTFSEILAAAKQPSGAVLEVGATPSETLLNLPALSSRESRIGIDLANEDRRDGYEILRCDAHTLPFGDGSFAVVLCNAMLEHDPFFWRTLAEMRRVLMCDGLMVIGVPGYVERSALSARMPVACTATLDVHRFPRDYYRFGEDAVREVFFEGLAIVGVRRVLEPPRFVAWGRKRK